MAGFIYLVFTYKLWILTVNTVFTVFVNQFFIHLQYIYVVDYTKLVTRFVQFAFRVRGVGV